MSDIFEKERDAVCSEHGPYVSKRIASMWLGCPECGRREQEQRDADERKRRHEEAVRTRIQSSGITGRYLGASFETFEVTTPGQQRALAACRAFAEDFVPDSGRTLVLIGPPGTGKTHLASAVGLALCARRQQVLFATSTDIVRAIRATWKRDGETEEEAIDSMVEPALLVIDDVALAAPTDNELRILHDVVDGRSRHLRPTLVTSNLTWPELQAAVGDRIADRLAENATVVPMPGESYRRRRA